GGLWPSPRPQNPSQGNCLLGNALRSPTGAGIMAAAGCWLLPHPQEHYPQLPCLQKNLIFISSFHPPIYRSSYFSQITTGERKECVCKYTNLGTQRFSLSRS